MTTINIRLGLAAGAALLIATLSMSPSAHRATERYIPIGKSPGASNENSVIGTVQATDAGQRIVTLRSENRPITISITARTRIWLDRSKLKKTNTVGRASELLVGRRVEIKFEDAERKQVADWIKIEITTPN